MAFNQVQQYFARAFDAAGRVIGDAAPFQWFTYPTNSSIATVDPANGVVTAKQTADSVFIAASVDGVTGKALLRVIPSLPTGSISSVVKDASTSLPIANASISAPACTTTSAADGSFTVGCVKSGDSLLVADSGYVSVNVYEVPAFPNKTIPMPDIPVSPIGPMGSVGTMTSKVVNAITGSGVSGMTIKAYAGLHAAPSPKRPDVTPVATATSDASGIFSISAAPGAYTFVASATGYSDAVGVGTSVANVTRTTPPIIVPPVIPGGGLFIMVTWGDCVANPSVPCDLDAHLTGPTPADTSIRFQVHSGNKSFVDASLVTADTIAALDAEKSTSPGRGPEVIGLRTAATPGIYRFYVKDMQNATNSTSTTRAA